MIDKIKSAILGDSVESLSNESGQILDVFTKTVQELAGVNSRIATQEQEKAEEKRKIEEDLATLATVKAKNNKVINNIHKILE